MAKLMAFYKTPVDPAAFDAHHHTTHLPLARTIPGLTGYDLSQGPVAGIAGPAGLHLIATLNFASMADIGAAMASAQGQATAADLANFAMAGVEVVMVDEVAV